VLGADAEAADSLYDLPERLARVDRVVVLGAEGRGLRPGVVKRIDQKLRIPLRGKVDSLNVSTAASVVLFELARRARRCPLIEWGRVDFFVSFRCVGRCPAGVWTL